MPQPSAAPSIEVAFAELFDAVAPADSCGFPRRRLSFGSLSLIRDVIGKDSTESITAITALTQSRIRWSAPADAAVSVAPEGGFLLTSEDPAAPSYWLPVLPRLVQCDSKNRLLRVEAAGLIALSNERGGLQAGFAVGAWPVETVIWRLPAGSQPLRPGVLERSAWFILGSHTVFRGRADVYRHLVVGTVYEDRVAWPNRWRVFSENDAHSLHLTLGGLARATADPVLKAMRRQLLLAVLDRQSADGGFRHGEWTELEESHYRLHCSAMHLMMDTLAERPDTAVETALRAAAAFISRQSVALSFGRWILHDELEHSTDKMASGPFQWVSSTVFGKAESNMLVLNSHLDATLALDRYAELTGDTQYAGLVQSARKATTAVLELSGAEPLYRMLFWLIGLTFLPTPQAAALPLWKRAFKRLAWQHLIPRLPDVKARWPRLVMPGGYIDRELTLRTWAHDYHAINLMDLARYLRRFPDPVVRRVLQEGVEFTRRSGILGRWRELDYQKYALGFWAEALYHVCTLFADDRYRQWLAEAMLVLEDLHMGQPPSLLGANAEAIPVVEQLPCPSPADPRVRVANLGRRGKPEWVVVNAGHDVLPLDWETPPADAVVFRNGTGTVLSGPRPEIPARGWLWGQAAQ